MAAMLRRLGGRGCHVREAQNVYGPDFDPDSDFDPDPDSDFDPDPDPDSDFDLEEQDQQTLPSVPGEA